MANHKTVNVLAATTVAAAWLWLFFFFHPRLPALDLRAHQAAGEALGAEALKLLEPGARLVVLARAPEPFLVPAGAAQLDGFLRTIKKSGQKVAVTREFRVDPLRPAAVPAEDFFDLMRQGRDNDVLISFLGPPVLSQDQLGKLGGKRPRVLAVCAGALPAQLNLKKVFDQKLLCAAVISRNALLANAPAASKQAAFAQQFKLVTAADVAEPSGTAANY
jgi:hypothetical protein